jgi:hypothetical protein
MLLSAMFGEFMERKRLILIGASALCFGAGAIAAETDATVVVVH